MSDPIDASARAALQKLADIPLPPSVSWWPQTWGWAVLGGLLLAVGVWQGWRAWRRWDANRYRREALAELDRLEAGPPQALAAALPQLLKQVALAAWQRTAVAPLSGPGWVAFLRANGGAAGFPDAAAALLDDMEYRATPNADDTRAAAKAVRWWIEGHVVPA
jgi:hypothetical protein